MRRVAALGAVFALFGCAPDVLQATGSSGSCEQQYRLTALRQRAFAFDGSVARIDVRIDPTRPEDSKPVPWVTFAVHRWFRGGTRERVSVWFDAAASDFPELELGDRLLVSGQPRFGGDPLDDPIAWGCGFTRRWDGRTAQHWSATFVNLGGE